VKWLISYIARSVLPQCPPALDLGVPNSLSQSFPLSCHRSSVFRPPHSLFWSIQRCTCWGRHPKPNPSGRKVLPGTIHMGSWVSSWIQTCGILFGVWMCRKSERYLAVWPSHHSARSWFLPDPIQEGDNKKSFTLFRVVRDGFAVGSLDIIHWRRVLRTLFAESPSVSLDNHR